MNAVDTNIYVHALDADEPAKQAKAVELFDQLMLKPVETGIRSHPHAALSIDLHFPRRIRTEPFAGCEAFACSGLQCQRRRPLLYMFKPFDALVRHRPQRAVRNESEIAELRIPLVRLAARRREGMCAQFARDSPKPLIIRKPDRTVRRLMQERIAGRRAIAILVLLKLRLAAWQKQEWTLPSLYP